MLTNEGKHNQAIRVVPRLHAYIESERALSEAETAANIQLIERPKPTEADE